MPCDFVLADAEAAAGMQVDSTVPVVGRSTLEFSPDGRWLAVSGSREGVAIYNTEQGGEPSVLAGVTTVTKMGWSPKATFLVTYQKFESEASEGNLKVHEVQTGEIVAAYNMKKLSYLSWPALQWTSDEVAL